jgi:1-deoxy-D-xylulose-5-phosphate reductoisomerase
LSVARNISILGATGSIGTQTLDVVRLNSEAFNVTALTANKNANLAIEQIREFRPDFVAIADPETAENVKEAVSDLCQIEVGEAALVKAASYPSADIVVAALVGFSCLKPLLAAIGCGKDVAIANKESLVAAGSLVKEALGQSASRLVPVDSEHNSLFQCLQNSKKGVRRVLITASGGPFLHHSKEQLMEVSPNEAVRHPRWDMGAKISIDSATLMNKGLEVIEAAVLFDLPARMIEVLVHPQSLVHGMVEYLDGSTHVVMYEPDMKVAISDALSRLASCSSDKPFHSESLNSGCSFLDFSSGRTLEFIPPDFQRFPCLKLAYRSLEIGGCAPLVLNAANEVAVESYLAEKIGFLQIPMLVEAVLGQYDGQELGSVDDILYRDSWAREQARCWLREYGHSK